MEETLDHLTKVAYTTFLRNIQPFAPALHAIQPEWEDLQPALQQAWRNAVQAALQEASEADA